MQFAHLLLLKVWRSHHIGPARSVAGLGLTCNHASWLLLEALLQAAARCLVQAKVRYLDSST
jgi:hypothetical protein